MKTSTGPQFSTGVTGDISHARRLEFDIIGDIINIANQLEYFSRELKISIVTSDRFLFTARQSDNLIRFLFAALKRDANIDVCTLQGV